MNRRNLLILLCLVLTSILLSAGLTLVLPSLPPVGYILLTSLVFFLLFVLFDRYLWRYLRLDNSPNIHGSWEGKLITSSTDNSHIEGIKIFIDQRWLTTRVDFIGLYSSSSSFASAFFRDENGQDILAYIYRSEPYKGSEDIVPAHIGLTVLRLVDAGRLSGYYHHL